MTHAARRYEALCASTPYTPTPSRSAAADALPLRLAARFATTPPQGGSQC
jgi:hypothetical protein